MPDMVPANNQLVHPSLATLQKLASDKKGSTYTPISPPKSTMDMWLKERNGWPPFLRRSRRLNLNGSQHQCKGFSVKILYPGILDLKYEYSFWFTIMIMHLSHDPLLISLPSLSSSLNSGHCLPRLVITYCTHNFCFPGLDITLCYFSYNSELQYSWTLPHTLVYKL